MQEIVYHSNFEIEEKYFWFIARNKIVNKIFSSICDIPNGSEVVDIGCGTGGFAKLLSEKYKVACMDAEPLALEYCKKRGLTDLNLCILKDFPKEGRNIKAAFMLDVIEHIENDKEVVKQVYDLLPKGGYFIASVPAYQWLWSHHDIMHMHYRRYNKSNFVNLLTSAGFGIQYSTYFNSFLLPAAVLKRFVDRFTGKAKEKNPPPVDEVSPFLNSLFTNIFSAEASFLPAVSFPFGLSIIVIARKM